MQRVALWIGAVVLGAASLGCSKSSKSCPISMVGTGGERKCFELGERVTVNTPSALEFLRGTNKYFVVTTEAGTSIGATSKSVNGTDRTSGDLAAGTYFIFGYWPWVVTQYGDGGIDTIQITPVTFVVTQAANGTATYKSLAGAPIKVRCGNHPFVTVQNGESVTVDAGCVSPH